MTRNFVLGLIASVVVVALALGGLALAQAAGDDRIELPDRVQDLTGSDLDEAYPSDAPDAVAQRQREAAEVDASGLADAYDAAAGSRVYVDADLDLFVAVRAVAAGTGPLVPDAGFVDPEALGLALPQEERITDGDVECLLTRSTPPRAGADYQPEDVAPDAVACQRTSGTLTVRARAATDDVELVVAVVDDVWDALG